MSESDSVIVSSFSSLNQGKVENVISSVELTTNSESGNGKYRLHLLTRLNRTIQMVEGLSITVSKTCISQNRKQTSDQINIYIYIK